MERAVPSCCLDGHCEGVKLRRGLYQECQGIKRGLTAEAACEPGLVFEAGHKHKLYTNCASFCSGMVRCLAGEGACICSQSQRVTRARSQICNGHDGLAGAREVYFANDHLLSQAQDATMLVSRGSCQPRASQRWPWIDVGSSADKRVRVQHQPGSRVWPMGAPHSSTFLLAAPQTPLPIRREAFRSSVDACECLPKRGITVTMWRVHRGCHLTLPKLILSGNGG